MPIFEAELEDGRIVEFESDNEPSEQDIFSALESYKPEAASPSESLMEDASLLALPEGIQIDRAPPGVFVNPSERRFQSGADIRSAYNLEPPPNVTRAVAQALMPELESEQSLFGLSPEMVPQGKGPLTVLLSSVGKTAAGIGGYLTSPEGITELVASATPARLLVMAKWAADMAGGAGQETGTLSTLVNKPNKTLEDWQQISDSSVNALAMIFGAGKTGSHVGAKLTGVRAPVGRMTTEPLTIGRRGTLAKDLAQKLNETAPEAPVAPVTTPERRLGIGQAPLTAEPFLQPGVPELADAALREAQQRVIEPGQEGAAANALRQAINPTQLVQVEPTRLAERIPGGGEAPYGKVSYMREAQAAPPVREMRPIEPGRGEEINAPGVEDVRAQRALEARQAASNKWDETYEELVGDLDSFSPARHTGVRDYNMLDAAERFIQFAKNNTSGKLLSELVSDFAKADGDVTASQARELRESAKNIEPKKPITASEKPPTADKILDKPHGSTAPEVIEALSDAEFNKLIDGSKGRKYSLTADATAWAMNQTPTPELIASLKKMRENETAANTKALAEKNWDRRDRTQWFSDALHVLEGSEVGRGNVATVTQLANRGTLKIADLITRLESLKFPETGEGRLYSLPHPDAIKAIGKATWNTAVDLAIAAVKAGKSIGDAIESALSHIRKNSAKFDEAQARANLEFVTKGETEAPPRAAASEPPKATPPSTDPITGEPAKMITEKAAKAMESKVKIPAQADVAKLTEQMNLFTKEIGDALETGGQFLAKELRPDVAKGAPSERGTVTSKEVNQYFVNKLSSIRKQMQATKQKIAQQADVESGVYFDLLQKRFEQAFRQVQELRRASHESLYFWNKIKAEYQDIARAAGEMPEMKRQLPVLDQIWKDMREKKYPQAGRSFVDFLRMNLFTMGSWTLDFGTNLIATGAKFPAWTIMDMGAMATGRAPTRMFSALRALGNNMRNWNPMGKRFRLPEQIESELGMTAGGEFGGRGREVMVDFSEILKDRPELAEKLRHIDKVIAAPVRMKRAVDSFFGRFGATAELYNRALIEAKTRGLKGDELKSFVEDFVSTPSEAAVTRAVRTGKELKFNRDLTKWEEAYAGNILTKLVVEAFPRWTLQFIRWGGEMTGMNPVFFKDLVTGKATPEQAVNYLTKAATGWGGLYAFNALFYDNVDANSMEYVKEDGNRVRLAGRTPAPELFFIVAMLRGDTEKAKAALAHLSVPGAKLLSGEPAGLISPLVDTIRESIRGRYTMEQTARELTKLVNDAIPGKSVFGLIRAIYDPTIREGIGSPIPGVSNLLPQRPNPTTGEPLAPKTRIPGTSIELPTVGGTPFPGAERVLNDIEKTLLNHGLGNTRPRRTSIIDLPAEDVPKETRREYEKLVGKNVQQFVGDVIRTQEFKELPFDVRRMVLSELLETSRTVAKGELAQKHGTSMRPIKSTPLNIERMPERLRK